MSKEKKKNTTLPFIKTSDKETMIALKAEGFELIGDDNGVWTFVNCTNPKTKFNFDTFEKTKNIAFSNMLCI